LGGVKHGGENEVKRNRLIGVASSRKAKASIRIENKIWSFSGEANGGRPEKIPKSVKVKMKEGG